MDEKEMDAVLAEMAQRRVDGLRRDARNSVALKLLNEHGSVTDEDIEAVLGREWREPDAASLGDQVAAKCAAAAAYERAAVEREKGEVERAYAKLAKVQEAAAALVDSARNEANVAEIGEALSAAERRLRDAEQLAEYAVRRGNPHVAANGTSTAVVAGTAVGKGV